MAEMTADKVLKDLERKMNGSADHLQRELAVIRTGRASLALVEGITVNYYGSSMPLNQVATLSVPDSRLITIQPWDQSVIGEVEKAILKSDLGLTPNNDGKIIRIAIPPLTEERRKELVKVVRKMAEETRVAVRNIRREGNESLKTLEKNKEISEDELRKAQDKVQKTTDQYVGKVDAIAAGKEKEVLEV